MAKDIYKIPESLEKNMGDMEIALQNADGVGVKPMPVKILLSYVISTLLCFFVISQTFIGSADMGVIVVFVLLWIAMTIVLLTMDKTGSPQATLIPTMLNYLPKQMRYVATRNSSKANTFRIIAGLYYDKETGVINFNDGYVGCIYRVVGSGSILLFDSDKQAILNRVDQFNRKIKDDCELIYITTKESQKVYRQVGNLYTRAKNLENQDPDLMGLVDMQYSQLKDNVGTSFRSVHQYMIVKAKNQEALKVAKNTILSEVENSAMVFKQCFELRGSDGEDVFKVIFQGKESV